MTDIPSRSLPDLVRSVVPLAGRALHARGEEAEAVGREAVRAAAAWFLGGGHHDRLPGHEFNRYALEQLMDAAASRAGLDRDAASAAHSAVEMLSEGVAAAARREQHSPGWVRPRLLSEAEAARILRGGIQHLVNMAVFVVTRDTMAAARAQDASAGVELDADTLAERVAPFAKVPGQD